MQKYLTIFGSLVCLCAFVTPVFATTTNEFVDEYVTEPTPVTGSLFVQGSCPTAPIAEDHIPIFTVRITKTKPLPLTFIPETLVEFVNPVTGDVSCLDETTATAFHQLVTAASLEGFTISLTSAFRSSSDQEYLYNHYGPTQNTGTYDRVALPGHSEHQTGTAVDIAITESGTYYSGYNLESSRGWHWLVQNASSYGFVMSYPKHMEHLTGYNFEPWHWRFVGKDNAVLLSVLNHTFAFADVIVPFQQGLIAAASTGL